MTRVIVVDDHPVFRRGLLSLLQASGLDVIGEATTGREAVALAADTRPDVVLLDLGLPDISGEEVIRHILANEPLARVLVLSLYQDDGSVERAIRAGARGYVVKDAPAEEVVAAVHAVGSGSAVIGGSISGRLATLLGGRDGSIPHTDFPGLTPREREILALIAMGMTNSAIAERLALSGKTVANYVSVVLAKIDASDRSDAVRIARQGGMVGGRHGDESTGLP